MPSLRERYSLQWLFPKQDWEVVLRGTCKSTRFAKDSFDTAPKSCTWWIEKCKQDGQERAWMSDGMTQQPMIVEHIRTLLASQQPVD